MNPPCLNCHLDDPRGLNVRRQGRFFRHSTQSWVRRYRCKACGHDYSDAIFEDAYRQKKRHLNSVVDQLLSHAMSQREVARTLRINYKTVVRKFLHQSMTAKGEFYRDNYARSRASVVQFDDLETFEHSKHKPLSVSLAVEATTRRILAFSVSQMPYRGRLSKKAREKYGKRADLRQSGRKLLFTRMQGLVAENAEIHSDQNPHYPSLVKRFFPRALHKRFKGKRGCVTGQGELKEGKYDPLFSLNHTCAMLRANVNRLVRKTWCTTKSRARLEEHLFLYANAHNKRLAARERAQAAKAALRPG